MAPFRFERFQVEKGMLRGIEGATKSSKNSSFANFLWDIFANVVKVIDNLDMLLEEAWHS